jgi:hypothetical protein
MDGAHQKRMLAYGEWLEDILLAPVPHRQYVFVLPKLIRPFFSLPPPLSRRALPPGRRTAEGWL